MQRMGLIGATAALVAALAIAVPGSAIAGPGGTDDPAASVAKKKKCKKKRGKKAAASKKCKKKRRGGGGAGSAAWTDGRYQGTYAENNVDLAFNVVGNRLFTGPFDAFFLTAQCAGSFGGGTDSNAYEPVQATIAPNGDFSGSGVYNTGYTVQPWTISGHIAGGQITNGMFSSSYSNTFGDPCGGATHFTAQWYGSYTL